MILLKKKSLVVVVFSSILIGLVLLMTMTGVYFYKRWALQKSNIAYRHSLSELNAQLFSKRLDFTKTMLRTGDKKSDHASIMVEGQIKNNSLTDIDSIKVNFSIKDPSGKILYVTDLYPVGAPSLLSFMTSYNEGNYLRHDDTISFRHRLRNVPKQLRLMIGKKYLFAKGKDLVLDFEIEEIILK